MPDLEAILLWPDHLSPLGLLLPLPAALFAVLHKVRVVEVALLLLSQCQQGQLRLKHAQWSA